MNFEKTLKKLIKKGNGFAIDSSVFDRLRFNNTEEKINNDLQDYLEKNPLFIICLSEDTPKGFKVIYNYGYLELVETKFEVCDNFQLYSFNELSKRLGNARINFGFTNKISLSVTEKNVSLY